MNDNDRARMNMVDVSDNILTINNAEWIVKAAFAALVTIFRNLKAEIEAQLLITERDDTGIAVDKADSRADLIAIAHRLYRAIYTFAMSTGDDNLARRVDTPLSSLQAMDDKQLVANMQILYTIADDNIADLADYDILPADVTALDDAITDFLDWKADPTTATSQRKTASDKLAVLIPQLMEHMSKRMDVAMYLFETSGTSFYGDWFNGRNIIQPGGADAQTQSGTNPIETDTFINLPFTNLAASKDVRIKCLTPGTNFDIYCSNAPAVPAAGTPLSVNDVISPVYTTTDDLGWTPETPYLNIHFPSLPVECEWEVKVG